MEEDCFGADNFHLAPTLSNLGVSFLHQGDYHGAHKLFEHAFELQVDAFGEHHPGTRTTRIWLDYCTNKIATTSESHLEPCS